MPILFTYKCAQCGERSEELEMGGPSPHDWVNVAAGGRAEWFDGWPCVAKYAAAEAKRTAAG